MYREWINLFLIDKVRKGLRMYRKVQRPVKTASTLVYLVPVISAKKRATVRLMSSSTSFYLTAGYTIKGDDMNLSDKSVKKMFAGSI